MTIVYFIIALSILIIVHEWGHFIVARLSNIRVEKFSVGFGPKLWSTKRKETEYRISALPFGGYVKMSGDDPADLDTSDEHAFYNKSALTRSRVVAAGPLMNFILCLILMPLVFIIGRSVPAYFSEAPQVMQVRSGSPADEAGIKEGDLIVGVNSEKISSWKELVMNEAIITGSDKIDLTIKRDGNILDKNIDLKEIEGLPVPYIGIEPSLYIGNEAVVDKVMAGSPADDAGIKEGDEIVSIDGKSINSWTDMVEVINEVGGSEVTVKLMRKGEAVETKLIPEYNKDEERYLLGISKIPAFRDIPIKRVSYGFFESLKLGFQEVGKLTELTFKVLWRLITFDLSYKSLGGPIKIAQASAAAARSGFGNFIYFLAFLSLQLGILNLLPIPVLDGGHLLFFGIEGIRKRPVSEKVQGVFQQIGFILIITLLLVISFNDVMQIESVRKFIDKIF